MKDEDSSSNHDKLRPRNGNEAAKRDFQKTFNICFRGETSYKVYAFFMLGKTYKMSFRCDSTNSSATEKFRCEIETEHKLNQRLHDLISSDEL